MACNQRDFRKDKPTRRGSLCGAKPRQKPLRVRIVCEFTPLDNIARNNSVQPVRSLCVSRANDDYLISNGVKILTIFERAVK